MTKLMSLTDAQRDQMAPFAQSWIEHGWRTTPLTEEEWGVVEDLPLIHISEPTRRTPTSHAVFTLKKKNHKIYIHTSPTPS